MLYTFILVLQALVAAALIGVILMQKSEGGGLGMGGSPAGFLSARGAADFLTRATAGLAAMFVLLSIVLAVLASINHSTARVDVNAARAVPAPAPAVPIETGPAVPLGNGAPINSANPLAGAADAAAPATQPVAPAVQPAEKGVPLQQ